METISIKTLLENVQQEIINQNSNMPSTSYEILQNVLLQLIPKTWLNEHCDDLFPQIHREQTLFFPDKNIKIPRHAMRAKRIADNHHNIIEICFEWIENKLTEGAYGEIFTLKDALVVRFNQNFSPQILFIKYREGFRQKILKTYTNQQKLQKIKTEYQFFSQFSDFSKKSLLFFDTENNQYAISMYRFHGNSLQHHLFDIKMSEQKICFLFFSFLKSIQIIHEQGVEHSDLKPENIIYDNIRGLFHCIDFGLSRSLTRGSLSAVTLRGTPLFFAPEKFTLLTAYQLQETHFKNISKQTDRYFFAGEVYASAFIFTIFLQNKHQNFPESCQPLLKECFPQCNEDDAEELFRYAIKNEENHQLFIETLLTAIQKTAPTLYDYLSEMLSFDPQKRQQLIEILTLFSEKNAKNIALGMQETIETFLQYTTTQTIELTINEERQKYEKKLKNNAHTMLFQQKNKLNETYKRFVNHQKLLQDLLENINFMFKQEKPITFEIISCLFKQYKDHTKPLAISKTDIFSHPVENYKTINQS